jgi:hypothetical protein
VQVVKHKFSKLNFLYERHRKGSNIRNSVDRFEHPRRGQMEVFRLQRAEELQAAEKIYLPSQDRIRGDRS